MKIDGIDFFSCRFRFYFYFFFFFRRSFVSSLNDAPGWCQKQVKTVKLNTLLVLSLLMPQIVNHKKREVKATHKHTHTPPHSHRHFQWNQRSKIEQKQGSTFLAGFDRCLLRFFPSYSTLFFIFVLPLLLIFRLAVASCCRRQANTSKMRPKTVYEIYCI